MKSDEQMHLLGWQLQAREPIELLSDMKAGDHLVRKCSHGSGSIRYEHHFICIGFVSKRWPLIIHYYNTPGNASKQIICTRGITNKQLTKVKDKTLHKYCIKNEDELQARLSDMNEGDHLVWERSSLGIEHHFVCIRFNENEEELPEVVHYTAADAKATELIPTCGLGSGTGNSASDDITPQRLYQERRRTTSRGK